MTSLNDSGIRLTPVQWLICVIAAIGFAFDIYEILMLPLIVRPALLELTGAVPGSPEFQMWVGRLFYIPAFAGGIFGLIGGYLTDRLGRRRVLTYSILIYAIAAFLSGFSTSIEMLLVLRCFVFIGVCVEFVAAVAWLAELFPEAKRREKVLGYTQAFSSLGGLLVAAVNTLCLAYAASLPSLNMLGVSLSDPHAPWRYTLMSGVLPAIPLILIRPFLPESPAWQQKKAAGTLRRPSIAALFAPDLRRTTIVTTIMFACAYGAAFGAIQQVQQIVPGVPDVRQMTQGMPPPRAALTTQQVGREGHDDAGVRGTGRAGCSRLSRRHHREPKKARSPVSGTRPVGHAVHVRHRSDDELDLAANRYVPRRVFHGRAIQLLGQLSPPGVSPVSARDGGKLRGEYRRASHRHVVRVALRHARRDTGPGVRPYQTRVRGGRRRILGVSRRIYRELLAAGTAEG